MIDDAIRSYLDAHRGEHLDSVVELLRFQSISAQPDHQGDCLACAQWLAEHLRGIGMTAEVITSTTKPTVLAQSEQRPDRPTLLVYGHYDVQPVDPLELWQSDPFDPVQRDGDLFARGASDDKGQVMTWIKAAEAYVRSAGELPVNLKFLIEGEEEIGSPSLEPFIQANAERLRCDSIVISDTAFFAQGVPSVITALRGLVYFEVKLTGASHDLHSGVYGGMVANPLNALSRLIAGLHDEEGRVTLKGFYDDVLEISQADRKAWDALNLDEGKLMSELGVDALAGETGFTPLQRNWARPVLDCHGLWGGYMGDGPKTVIPSWAKAKCSCRLVCNQDPQAIETAAREYFQDNCPPGTKVEITSGHAAEAWQISADAPELKLASAAMQEAFDAPCTAIRCGASVPITILFRKYLGVDPLMMGYGLPNDRVHSPNEKFTLDQYYRGILAGAGLMRGLAEKGV